MGGVMYSEEALVERLDRSFDSQKTELPLFDKTVVKIMKELARDEPDIKKLGRIIITDQSLTAQVLKVANSTFFRRLHRVSTVEEAILRLGINWISNIVVLLTQREKFASDDPLLREMLESLWRHSVASGMGTLWIVEHKGLTAIKPEAFIAGLLHDEGKLVVLTLIDQLRRTEEIDSLLPVPMIEVLMDRLHPRYGAELMQQWNLPDVYCNVARDHHSDAYDKKDKLLCAVRVANQASNSLGIGVRGECPVELAALEESQLLDLDFETLQALEQSLHDSRVLARA